MKVNLEPNKVLIQGDIIDCGRGQSLLSLQSWVKEFGVNKWSIQKIRTFFKLLEKDKMINIEGSNKTTRITVCNFDDYQTPQQADNTQPTSKQHAPNTRLTTIKELKNDKNKKEKIIKKDSVLSFYADELFRNRKKRYAKEYLFLAKTLHGKINGEERYSNLLKLEKQLKYDGFVKMLLKAKNVNKSAMEVLKSMENKKDLTKKYTSVGLTALNWLRI